MKLKNLIRIAIIFFNALFLWEFGTRLWERQKTKKGKNYWETYYPPEIVNRANSLRQTAEIISTGVELHIDIYPQSNPAAPTVIFNHGAAGYCRIFVSLALKFHDRGFNVILPDQRGQGFSGGRRGDYTIAECTQNILDVAQWAKEKFPGPLLMMGGSVGGALTYYTAAAGAPVEAIVCLNLFDFGNGIDGLAISRLSPIAKSPVWTRVTRALMASLNPLHWVRLPFGWFGAFDKLMDERDISFQQQWDEDPIPPRLVSLRSLASNLNSPPAIPFEQNQVPILVINQKLDQMVDPQVTKRNFERLGGRKEYQEIPFGHWSNQPEFWQSILNASEAWFRENIPVESFTLQKDQ